MTPMQSTPVCSSRLHGAVLAAMSAAMSAALFAGCSSVKLDSEVPVESRTATKVGAGTGSNPAGAATGAAGQSTVTPVDLTNKNANGTISGLARVVYFDFDSFAVKDEYRGVVEGQSKLLAADRKKRVAVEGHTDERGGREYNLALGQKRAEAVAKAMTLLGATDAQVEAVSFGKERPAATGGDDAAMAKNRRAEINAR